MSEILFSINNSGRLHTWSPQFSEYEVTMLIVSGIAIIFIVSGIIDLERKQP